MGRNLGVEYKMRMSQELKDKIAESAKELNRSINTDIVATLEESFENNKKKLKQVVKTNFFKPILSTFKACKNMIEDFSIFLSIITAELLSLFILYLFGCKMKGKYWYTLFFILAFLVLFCTACIFYLNFNPIDKDTLKQSQATDLIYIFTAIATLLAPIVIILSLDSWKESFNAEKYDKLFIERATICANIQKYILYNLSTRLSVSKKNILEVIKGYSEDININEFYSKIDVHYHFITQDLSILREELYINSLNIIFFENKETIETQSDILKKVNLLTFSYVKFKEELFEAVREKKIEKFITNFDELQAWKELENMNSRTDIIVNISKLKTIKKAH